MVCTLGFLVKHSRFFVVALGCLPALATAQAVRTFLAYGDAEFATLNGALVGDPLSETVPVLIPRRSGGQAFRLQVRVSTDSTLLWNAALGFVGFGRGDAQVDPFTDRSAFEAADLDGRLTVADPVEFALDPSLGWLSGGDGTVDLAFQMPPVLRGAAFPDAGLRALGTSVFLAPPIGENARLESGFSRRLFDVALVNRGLPAGDTYGVNSPENGLSLDVASSLDDGQNAFLDAATGDLVRPPYIRYAVRAAPNVLVAGRVLPSGWLGPESFPKLKVEVREIAGGEPILTRLVQPASDGTWQAELPLEGSYLVRVKPDRGLAVNLGQQDLAGMRANLPDANVRLGDLDDDNTVTVFDYDGLSRAFDTQPGDADWNPLADFDGDGAVTVFDYDLLSMNFDLIGD